MSRLRKIIETILGGSSDANIRFADFRRLLKAVGFEERVRGDHFIYCKDDIEEIVNL